MTERHELSRSIICLLPLPGSLLMVSLAKGNLALYRCNREGGKLEVASALKVSGDNKMLRFE